MGNKQLDGHDSQAQSESSALQVSKGDNIPFAQMPGHKNPIEQSFLHQTMKDPKHADKDKIKYFFLQCEITKKQNKADLMRQKLRYRDKFFHQTTSHACARNGHVAILVRIIKKLDSTVAEEKDGQGNLPLHQLCKNTTSSPEDLLMMFWVLIEAFQGAIEVANALEQKPIDIIEKRLNTNGQGYKNPYEVNLSAIEAIYENLKQLSMRKGR